MQVFIFKHIFIFKLSFQKKKGNQTFLETFNIRYMLIKMNFMSYNIYWAIIYIYDQ